jgi:hypothetical protein
LVLVSGDETSAHCTVDPEQEKHFCESCRLSP